MVDQLPGASFEPENVGRALIEGHHRTLRRAQLAGLGADRVAHVRATDDSHVPLRDIAVGIEPSHILKTRVNLVPSHRVTACRAQVRYVRAVGPDSAEPGQ